MPCVLNVSLARQSRGPATARTMNADVSLACLKRGVSFTCNLVSRTVYVHPRFLYRLRAASWFVPSMRDMVSSTVYVQFRVWYRLRADSCWMASKVAQSVPNSVARKRYLTRGKEMPKITQERKRKSEHWRSLISRTWLCQDCEIKTAFKQS